jgi:hypothetical protein
MDIRTPTVSDDSSRIAIRSRRRSRRTFALTVMAALMLALTGCDDNLVLVGEIPGSERGEGADDSSGPNDGDPTAPPNAVRECDTPRQGWIFCDDFERDRLDGYFAHSASNGQFTRAPGVGVEGSHGMKVRWEAGQVSAGALQVMVGRNPVTVKVAGDPTRDYRELYWRMYVRHQPGFRGGGADKLSRATVLAGSDWRQAMIAHVWSGKESESDRLVVDPASGTDADGNVRTTRYNDFDNLRWLGITAGRTRLFDESRVGEWYCVEAHVRLNEPGRSDGVFTLWIDDEPEVNRTALNWMGSYAEYGLNGVFFENYWNLGSPVAQERYFDSIVISTERIGCHETA